MMADVFTPEKRSEVMSKIRGKDTRIELTIRKELWSRGYQYWKNVRRLPGKPDALLRSYPVAVFTHSCYFHGHETNGRTCNLFRWPSPEYMQKKIQGNRERDERQVKELLSIGYRVLVIWECALKGKKRLDRESLMGEAIDFIHSNEALLEISGNLNPE